MNTAFLILLQTTTAAVQSTDISWINILQIAGVATLITAIVSGAINTFVAWRNRVAQRESDRRRIKQADNENIAKLFSDLAGQIYMLKMTYSDFLESFSDGQIHYYSYTYYNSLYKNENNTATKSIYLKKKDEFLNKRNEKEKEMLLRIKEHRKIKENCMKSLAGIAFITNAYELQENIKSLTDLKYNINFFKTQFDGDISKTLPNSAKIKEEFKHIEYNKLIVLMDKISRDIFTYRASCL